MEGLPLYVLEAKELITPDSSNKKYTEVELNQLFSEKQLGAIVANNKTTFRIFAPNPVKVELVLFDSVNDSIGTAYPMTRDTQAVWEYQIDSNLTGKYYAYLVYNSEHINKNIKPQFSVDPYAKAVATYTDYFNPRKAIVYANDNFDWENDSWIKKDWDDLIIYEMHIRDLTTHPSAKSKFPGTYKGLFETDTESGIKYIKSLGVNTVELLPAQEYGYYELPFKDSLRGRYNTWNPYERNHWGYMTSNFFAPAAYYSENIDSLKKNIWIGQSGKQVTEFKEMVKAFHKEGIAIIMDVVFNHLSEYELGNLKEIDKEYYFRLDSNQNFISESYCGNDLKTERPMLRKLIVESILYWMKEYHIDGFRFDLAKLIDWETIETIIREARKINPQVVFICEPWGGGYDPKGFSLREWSSWNDQIRNGVKGENPNNGLGWIFGKWYGNNNKKRIESYVKGTLISDKHGLFQESKHAVNYLESHDGYTLGDFIRIGIGKIASNDKVKDKDELVKLTDEEMRLHKLAAMFLFTSKGITMIHSGQEFGRSKIIQKSNKINDEKAGELDHNSYNKDNETNYINYADAEKNSELFNYYKGLIKLRKNHDAFRRADNNDYKFLDIKKNKFAVAYFLTYKNNTYFVAFNADRNKKLTIDLPEGWWKILADDNSVLNGSAKSIKGTVNLKPSTGLILLKK
ncbi:MAG: pullulanase [Ignavibacteriae bacterium]|nr:MAG: pullulanase [Ignavibacteriota bacterium]